MGSRETLAGLSLALVVALVISATGCGYHAGYAARKDIGTVAVGVFGNRTFYRDIETDFTRAVISEIQKNTPYRIVASGEADAILEGEIVSYRKTMLQESADDEPMEVQVVLTVNATLRNRRNGAVLFKNSVREAEDYAPAAGENESGMWPRLSRRTAELLVERAFDADW
ncbi:MAG: LptE family protein [Planctomycetes bacterium]|nr:LptE family protein [Planctomycetota bacterium]